MPVDRRTVVAEADESSAGPHPSDAAVAATLVAMLEARRPGSTMCPSEVARACAPSESEWRALMPRVRAVAAELVAEGRVQATRRGEVVDPTSPGGPIRLARVDASPPRPVDADATRPDADMPSADAHATPT